MVLQLKLTKIRTLTNIHFTDTFVENNNNVGTYILKSTDLSQQQEKLHFPVTLRRSPLCLNLYLLLACCWYPRYDEILLKALYTCPELVMSIQYLAMLYVLDILSSGQYFGERRRWMLLLESTQLHYLCRETQASPCGRLHPADS